MAQEFQNYIGGQWVAAQSNERLEWQNPATGELLHTFPRSTKADVDAAVHAARRAFETTDWRTNPEKRIAALNKFAAKLRQREEELRTMLIKESGKLFPVARTEVTTSAQSAEYYAGLVNWVYGRANEPTENSLSILLREPIGVVGQITPWNLPLALFTRPLAPAFAAGCAVVAKPAEQTSGIAALVAQIISEIEEIPAGIFNLVTGLGEEAGDALTRHEDVDMINFTGGTDTGRLIMQAAATNLKKVSLELGGKSPNIVFGDADFERAIKNALNAAAFWNAGQVCTAGSRLLVEASRHGEMVEKLQKMVSAMKVGPTTEKVGVGPVISQEQLDRVLGYVELGKKEATLVAGGRGRLTEGSLANGFFVEPAVFDNVDPNSRLAQEEVFGPVLSVIPFNDVDDAIRIANNTRYGLVAAVWTKDLDKALTVAKKVRAGTVWVNTYGKLYHSMEFGGVKQSGLGRHYGLEGLLEFTELKHIHIQLGGE
jgi:betaine-aldehyde dehydrogenase